MTYSETILIPTNPHTTCPVVRYAFVTVSSPSEAECAINELNGKSIMGRKVSVQLARRPEPAAATKESFGVPVDHANAATGQHDFATDVAALTGNWQRTDTSTEQAKVSHIAEISGMLAVADYKHSEPTTVIWMKVLGRSKRSRVT